MNRVFKSIWNSVTQSWTAVSEAQRAKRKNGKKAVVLGLLSLSLFNMPVLAESWYSWPWSNEINLTGTVGIGQGSSIQTYDDLTVYEYSSRTLYLDDANASLNVNGTSSSQLLSQSYGSEFQIVKVNDNSFRMYQGLQGLNFSLKNSDGSSNYTQSLTQSGGHVANATYLIGQGAREFLENHLNYTAETEDGDSRITFNGNQYSSTGINYRGNKPLVAGSADTSKGTGFWSLAILREINLLSTLELMATEDSEFAANITGDGSIRYVSSSSNQSKVTLEGILAGDKNAYTGETIVDNVWLVLNKNTSLGQTSELTASNNALVEVAKGAETVGDGGFNFDHSTLKANHAISTKGGASFENQSTLTANAEVNIAKDLTVDASEITVAATDGEVSVEGNGLLQNGSTLNLNNGNAFNVTNNLTIDESSHFSGANVNLAVGGLLTIGSGNADVTAGTVKGQNVILKNVGAVGGAELTVEDTLTFQDISSTENTFKTTVVADNAGRKVSVNVENSTVEYDRSQTIQVSETEISGNSNLIVHDSTLLGTTVTFTKDDQEVSDAHSMLTIYKNGEASDGSWTIDSVKLSNQREDDKAIVYVKGEGFKIDQALDYNGWIRLGDMNFELTEKVAGYLDNAQDGTQSTGLSIGSGATVIVKDSLELDKFGWSRDGEKGVLELDKDALSQEDKDKKTPVLHVTNLYLDAKGSIKLDPTVYVGQTGSMSGGSVLDYDNGDEDNRYFVITADNVVGTAIPDLDYDDESTGTTTKLKHGRDENAQVAAVAHWNYIAGTTEGQALDGKRGVYISYGLEELELVGEDDSSRSLVIDLSTSEDTNLEAQVTGHGIIDIVSKDSTKNSVYFKDTENDFKGTVNVDKGIILSAEAGSLSGGKDETGKVNVKLAASSQLRVVGEAGVDKQYLKAIQAGISTTVDISEGTQLILTGKGKDQASEIKGTLSGQGDLVLQGSQAESNVETLNGFQGAIAATNNGTLKLDVATDISLTTKVSTEAGSWLVKRGQGQLSFDFDDTSTRSEGDPLNVRVTQGSVLLDSQTTFGNIDVDAGSQGIYVDGLATISGLSGSGNIYMDVEFGSSANTGALGDASDALKVNGTASGDFTLIAEQKALSKGAVESVRVMEVDGEADNFSLTLAGGYITSGAYDYRLVRTDDDAGTSFDLSSYSDGDSERTISVTAGSYVGIAYAAQLFDLSLHDRVGNRDWINPVTGEKETTSLWMHHTMSHERFRDSTQQLRMRTTANTTMLGGDIIQFTAGEDGLVYAGLMGGYGTMDTKTRSKVTDLDSKAETDAWGVGAYAGWKANTDGQIGPYVDGWVMFTHASSDVTGVDQDTDNVKGQGLSAQLEAGWGFKVGSVVTENGKIANFTVEPHASVTWFGMEYDEIHNAAQDVQFEGKDNIRTRLGARAILTEEGNKDFNAFVEANWVHNTKEYGATISGLTVDQTGSRNQGEARIGVDWRLTQDVSVWGRVGAAFGSDGYSEREGSVGIRYQF